MSSNDLALSVRGLSKAYTITHNAEKHSTLAETVLARVKDPFRRAQQETFWALKDVSFDVRKGEVVGIIGRNGAGKSTLLKILSRITEPTSGEARLYGRVGSLLEVGTGFHPELTGRENIYINGQILGMRKKEIDKHFDAIVNFAEVEKFIDTPVKRYSSGMYVRLAFAVAAHLASDILIVDEVLAVGDFAFQKKCVGKMSEVARNGRTVVFVSHDLTTILKFCRIGVHLSAGELTASGPIGDIVTKYVSEGKPQDSRILLRELPRASPARGRATLLEARLGPAETTAHWKLPFGADICLEIKVHVHQPLSRCELGLGLFTMTGLELASSLSSYRLPDSSVGPGIHQFKVRYREFALKPGTYRFSVGIRSESGFEDYIPDAFLVEIIPTRDAAHRETQTLGGHVIPRVDYCLLPANADIQPGPQA